MVGPHWCYRLRQAAYLQWSVKHVVDKRWNSTDEASRMAKVMISSFAASSFVSNFATVCTQVSFASTFILELMDVAISAIRVFVRQPLWLCPAMMPSVHLLLVSLHLPYPCRSVTHSRKYVPTLTHLHLIPVLDLVPESSLEQWLHVAAEKGSGPPGCL